MKRSTLKAWLWDFSVFAPALLVAAAVTQIVLRNWSTAGFPQFLGSLLAAFLALSGAIYVAFYQVWNQQRKEERELHRELVSTANRARYEINLFIASALMVQKTQLDPLDSTFWDRENYGKIQADGDHICRLVSVIRPTPQLDDHNEVKELCRIEGGALPLLEFKRLREELVKLVESLEPAKDVPPPNPMTRLTLYHHMLKLRLQLMSEAKALSGVLEKFIVKAQGG